MKSKSKRKQVSRSTGSASGAATKEETSGESVAGINISNPAKVLYPEAGITKLELARYYEAVAEWILPHLERRPLTLVRCPNGWEKKCFFQKHPNDKVSSVIDRVMVEESDGPAPYMVANSPEAVVALLQMGALELHVLGAASPKLACPDRLVFDLDPAEDIEWTQMAEAVQLLKILLEEIGLEVFVKTTGGKGLHVVLPVERRMPWDEAKAWARDLAAALAKAEPGRFLINMSKAKRRGKIFIDYLRNDEKSSAVAPYSTRAREGAPFALPLAWDALAALDGPVPVKVGDVVTGADPWAGMGSVRQRLPARRS